MMALLYAAAGMLAGALLFQLLGRPGREERTSLRDQLLTLHGKLETLDGRLRALNQPGARGAPAMRAQPGEEAGRARQELERLDELGRKLEELAKKQTTAVHKLEEVQLALHARWPQERREQLDPGPRPPSSSSPRLEPEPERSATMAAVATAAAAAAAAQAPRLAGEPPDAVARLVSLWNNLPWPQHAGEALQRFRAELGSYQLAGPFKHRYWLLHGAASERLFLLPVLGKDVSLFGDGFFEMPTAGNTRRMRTPAEVCLREDTPLGEALARLTGDSNITPNDIFSPLTRGHLE
jgi:hypothetical protein